VLVEKAENLAKGNKYLSAADYIKQVKGEAEFQAFMNRVNDCKGFSRTKKARLLATELPNDFINRQLADTRYVGKKLKEILREVCRNVTSTTGGVTAYLREQWELDTVFLKDDKGKVQLDKNGFSQKVKESLLKEMRFEQYPHLQQRDKELQKLIESGKATDKDKEKYRAEQRKNRDDHRHHLLDAVVIAFTTQKHIQYLNNLNAAYENPKEAQKAKDERIFDAPLPNFRQVIKGVLAGTLVSFRGTKKIGSWRINPATGKRELTPRGYLHKETLYGSVQRYEVLKIGKKLFEQIDHIVDTELKTQLQSLLKQYGEEWGALEKYLKKKPLLKNGKPVEEITVFSRQVTAKYALSSIVEKDTQYIVDKGIRLKVEQHLRTQADIDEQIKALQAKKPKTLEDEAAIREL
ncbi:MAG: type II CRISPR RNA-guided endonuclease Cas9, partial [Thermoflexibacteraceae bacterium]